MISNKHAPSYLSMINMWLAYVPIFLDMPQILVEKSASSCGV